jgi:hypothetical protein
MRTVRLGVSILAAAALVPLTASAASAAAPANDRPKGAVSLTLGGTVSEDTSKATTGTLDAKLNAACGAPFTNASVWYTYTPTEDGTAILDMSGSSYSGGFMIFQGSPTLRHMIGCGPTEFGIAASAGTTYTIMVFSDTSKNGGKLNLSLQPGPPPPSVTVTVNPNGKVYGDGTAQISGTYSCLNADFLDLEGQLTQVWRRVKITGYFSVFVQGQKCDGAEHPWKQVVSSDNGLYAKGAATVSTDTLGCGLIDCTDVGGSTEVTLGSGAPTAPNVQSATGVSCKASRSLPLYAQSQACRMGATTTS